MGNFCEFAKVIEYVVKQHIHKHFSNNDLYSTNLHGYQLDHSLSTTMDQIINTVKMNRVKDRLLKMTVTLLECGKRWFCGLYKKVAFYGLRCPSAFSGYNVFSNQQDELHVCIGKHSRMMAIIYYCASTLCIFTYMFSTCLWNLEHIQNAALCITPAVDVWFCGLQKGKIVPLAIRCPLFFCTSTD